MRGEVPQELEIAPKKDALIVILLSLTLIKAVEQSVKNDFIQALGRQGLVGLPHRHLHRQGEEPSC